MDRLKLIVVASGTRQSGDPVVGFPSQGRGLMNVPVVALVRLVTGRMAIHAAWAHDNLRCLARERPRSGILENALGRRNSSDDWATAVPADIWFSASPANKASAKFFFRITGNLLKSR